MKFCSCCSRFKSIEGAVTGHYFQRLVPAWELVPANARARSLDYISASHVTVFQPTRIQKKQELCYKDLYHAVTILVMFPVSNNINKC